MDPIQRMNLYEQMSMQNQGEPGMMPQEQEIPQSSYNPISSGTLAGMKAAKQSIGMDEDEKRRALGMAIFQYGASMANSRNTDQFGRINESLSPAVKAYMAEQQRVQNLNANLLENEQARQDAARKEAIRRQEHEENLAIKREALQTRNKEDAYERQMEYVQKLRDSKKIPQNARPLSILPSHERHALSAENRENVKRGNGAYQVVNITRQIDKITDKYPDLSTDIVNALMTANKENRGAIDIAKLNIADTGEGKKKRAELEKFNKLSNDLVLNGLEGVAGRVASDMYKTILTSTKPTPGMTHEAIKYVNNHIRKQYMPIYEHGKNSIEAIAGDYYIPRPIPEIEEEAQEEPMIGNNAQLLQPVPQENVPRGTNMPVNSGESEEYTQEEIEEANRRLKAKRLGQ